MRLAPSTRWARVGLVRPTEQATGSAHTERQIMAKKNEPYEVKRVATGYTNRKVARLVKKGWEVVAQRGGVLGSAGEVTLRRPNPRYRGE
ncbi:hypothetical protein SEA_NICOLE72_18 [Microbacterium phage Nicole72]|uniref:Uncharacterized protein n=1 Tax=Microbacterium phage Nicole72 TaxID=3062838 RepID=A0ACD4UL01_9CAUD|nr:hypothetical protein SEA_NICOLE72_18 [Microbacterium phage Nicole72]